MFHLLSLVLGILAWILGGSAAVRGSFGGSSLASMSLCGISLTAQFYGIARLADLGDWSAIDDTVGAITFAAAVLLAVTVALNAIAFRRGRGR